MKSLEVIRNSFRHIEAHSSAVDFKAPELRGE